MIEMTDEPIYNLDEQQQMPAILIHEFEGEQRGNYYKLYVQLCRHGFRLYQGTDGPPIEVPDCDDEAALNEWLEGTGLSIDQLLERVRQYEIWS